MTPPLWDVLSAIADRRGRRRRILDDVAGTGILNK